MVTRGTAALGTGCPPPACRCKIKMLSNTNTPKGQESLIAREKNRREGKAFLSQHYGVIGQDTLGQKGPFCRNAILMTLFLFLCYLAQILNHISSFDENVSHGLDKADLIPLIMVTTD